MGEEPILESCQGRCRLCGGTLRGYAKAKHTRGESRQCIECGRYTLVNIKRPRIKHRDAVGRYRHQNRDGTLSRMHARYEAGVSVKELAEEAGVNIVTIYRRLKWIRTTAAAAM